MVIAFPKEFPPVRVGTLLLDQNILITGHANGFVVKWDIPSGEFAILFKCGSPVETISKSQANEIAVGCNSGLLFTFPVSNPTEQTVLQEAQYTKASRVWRSTWVSRDSLFVSSTYGVLNVFQRQGGEWQSYQLSGHSDSIFGVDGSNDTLVASGDWSGKIVIRQYVDGNYQHLDNVKIPATVEGISWHKDSTFATVDERGHISYFEPDSESPEWKLVFETDTASSRGNCVLLTEDGKSVFAGTNTELIQFDVDTQQVKNFPILQTKAIFSQTNFIYVLTATGLLSFERTPVIVPEESVKYQYSKVSLIGHTGSGKTTLCSLITSGKTENIKTTFGKRIWNWILPSEEGVPERRIVLHDHGGQETVLDTFLPFLADSDVVLIFFKRTDIVTFRNALKIRDELEAIVTSKTKVYFVETFIDQGIEEFDRKKLNELIARGKIIDCLQVSPTTGNGVQEFKHTISDTINWNSMRTMIRSETVESVEKSINALIAEKTTVIPFANFKAFHENNTTHQVTTNHLKFLLSNFSTMGLIEYYPEVLNSIIFNDETYSKLRTNIPILIEQKKGILSISEIEDSFGNPDYVKMIDQVYLTYGLAIENDNLRIYPGKLKDVIDEISGPYKKLLDNAKFSEENVYPKQAIRPGRLLKALSDLGLKCIDASKSEGLFAWERNACIYYKYEEAGNALKGYFLHFTFTIGGEKESVYNRLKVEFESIIDRLYGPRLFDASPDKLRTQK
ncbi:MAG TPA: hypothetical protein VJP79_12340 [Nitrososphaera sp.]|nr:hypothetical protein [Nitrososphaera sp.]